MVVLGFFLLMHINRRRLICHSAKLDHILCRIFLMTKSRPQSLYIPPSKNVATFGVLFKNSKVTDRGYVLVAKKTFFLRFCPLTSCRRQPFWLIRLLVFLWFNCRCGFFWDDICIFNILCTVNK